MVGRDSSMEAHSHHANGISAPQAGPSISMTTATTDTTTRTSLDAPTVTSPPRTSIEITPEIPELILPDGPSSPSRRSFRERVERRRFRSRSISSEREQHGDTSAGKRVQKMLKEQVHKQSARINTFSKRIGHGVAKGGNSILHRASSAPGAFSRLLDIP